jgi:hypothetical protein
MSNREFSSSRPQICPRKDDAVRVPARARRAEPHEAPYGQHKRESLSIHASCRNVCHALSPQHAQGTQCTTDAPAVTSGEHGRHHNHSLELRHRRIPEEREVADPEETNAPEEEDTPEEEAPDGREDDEKTYSRNRQMIFSYRLDGGHHWHRCRRPRCNGAACASPNRQQETT